MWEGNQGCLNYRGLLSGGSKSSRLTLHPNTPQHPFSLWLISSRNITTLSLALPNHCMRSIQTPSHVSKPYEVIMLPIVVSAKSSFMYTFHAALAGYQPRSERRKRDWKWHLHGSAQGCVWSGVYAWCSRHGFVKPPCPMHEASRTDEARQ